MSLGKGSASKSGFRCGISPIFSPSFQISLQLFGHAPTDYVQSVGSTVPFKSYQCRRNEPFANCIRMDWVNTYPLGWFVLVRQKVKTSLCCFSKKTQFMKNSRAVMTSITVGLALQRAQHRISEQIAQAAGRDSNILEKFEARLFRLLQDRRK